MECRERSRLMGVNETSVFELSPSEKLQLVEDLWDDLATTPSNIPIHEWQVEELERRKKRLKSASAPLRSWEDIKTQVRSHHAR
jgi:putative addiction module component (TIGR02574 family)